MENEWKYSDRAKVTIINRVSELRKRTEMVQFRGLGTGSYENIYNESPMTLRDLDNFFTIFTEGTKQIYSNEAACLHYLMFGTEVMRNPSALIHSMMILDLIQSGNITWKTALTEIMPMSQKGSVMGARIKNIKYNGKYMPRNYLYDLENYHDIDKEENISALKALLHREKVLMMRWLKQKHPTYLDEEDNLNEFGKENLFNLLQKSCKTWYNIEILCEYKQETAKIFDSAALTRLSETPKFEKKVFKINFFFYIVMC